MLIRSLIFLCALFFGVGHSNAEAEWQKELGPLKPGNHPSLPAGKMEFSLSWKGIVDSGKLTFDIGKAGAHKPGVIVIRSTGKSMGAGGTIFPYQGSSWTEINADNLRPRYLTAIEDQSGKKIETENRFFSNRVSFREVTKEKKEQSVKSHVFSQSPVYDIGSAILFIRSQKLNPGDTISFMMQPYGSPYLLKAKVLGKEKLNQTDCIKVSLDLSKIDRDTLKLKPYKKLKEPALLWFSDDKMRLPLEIRSKVFIGDIRATLDGFKQA